MVHRCIFVEFKVSNDSIRWGATVKMFASPWDKISVFCELFNEYKDGKYTGQRH